MPSTERVDPDQQLLFAESWAGLHALSYLASREPCSVAMVVICTRFSLASSVEGGRARLAAMVGLAARVYSELTGQPPEPPDYLDQRLLALEEMPVAALLAVVRGGCHAAVRELDPFALREPDCSPALLRPLVDELRALSRTCWRASLWHHSPDDR